MVTTEANVQSFYQSGDADWTAAFQRAINNGVSFYVPEGSYAISQSLNITNSGSTTSGLRIRGLGQSAVIQANNTNFNLLNIGSSSTSTINVGLENIHFSTVPGVKLSGGAIINATNAARLQFRDVNVGSYEDYASQGSSYLYKGVVLNNCSDVVWRSGAIIGCQQQGLLASATSQTSASISIGGQAEIAYCNIGVQIDGGCGGVSIGDANIQFNTIGMEISGGSGVNNREVFLGYDCYLDTNSQYGLLISNNGVVYLECSGTWFAGSGVNVCIQATQPSGACFKFTGARIYSAVSDGFQHNSGQLILTGCAFELNGKGSSGGQGLTVQSAVVPPLINSSFFRANGLGLTGYGVGITGSESNFMLDGCVFQGNKSGAISAPTGTRGTNLML